MTLAFIFIIHYSILLQDHIKQLCNMSKKSAVIKAKFKVAVKTLLKRHTLTDQEAMLVRRFFGEGTTELCNRK